MAEATENLIARLETEAVTDGLEMDLRECLGLNPTGWWKPMKFDLVERSIDVTEAVRAHLLPGWQFSVISHVTKPGQAGRVHWVLSLTNGAVTVTHIVYCEKEPSARLAALMRHRDQIAEGQIQEAPNFAEDADTVSNESGIAAASPITA